MMKRLVNLKIGGERRSFDTPPLIWYNPILKTIVEDMKAASGINGFFRVRPVLFS
jgi:hypothetical protein